MRKLAFLMMVLVATAACGAEVAATGAASRPAEPTADLPTPTPQATATPITAESFPTPAVTEQQFKDLQFRLSELERLMSAGDGMFSLEDDLSNVDGRLRAQQRCINALVLTAGRHQHSSDIGGGITGPGKFGTLETSGLDASSLARMLAVECGPAVDEGLLAQLTDVYGIAVLE